MVLLVFYIKSSFYDLFIYLFIFKFLVFLLTKNYHFRNFFFCVTFAYFSVNGEIQLTHLLIDWLTYWLIDWLTD